MSIPLSRAVGGNGTFNFVVTGLSRTTLSSREGGRRPQLIVGTEPPPQTLVAAGDIADCATNGDEQTAALVDTIQGAVAALGDLAYESGTSDEFARCYEPTWGRFKARTKPITGNHEYFTPGATGYFAYWAGTSVGNPNEGWYSYELGAWHVVALNSNCSFVGGCHPGSPQETWLRADLAGHRARCTLVYWHHPRFSTGEVGDSPAIRPLFQALYDANADLLLVAHSHTYQRWLPLSSAGAVDQARGIRQFVVGTGGRRLHEVSPGDPRQQVANDDTFGVLRLTLRGTGYDWTFVPVAGRTFTDSGTQACH